MEEFRADLHCHTTCSDGTTSPADIVKLALEKGLSGLAITDHDSIDAYGAALPLSEKMGLRMISGAEFSTVHQGVSVHLLGYSFPLNNPLLQKFCEKHNQRRQARNLSILELLKKEGMPITEEEVDETAPSDLPKERRTVGRPHIAQAMIKKGYVDTISNAFKKYLGEGKICYAQGESFSVEETLDVIHQAKGLAVIAHPHLIRDQHILHQLLQMNFDGIESYYAKFPMDAQTRWVKIAQKKGWLITGGSDYHGEIKPTLPLGNSWVTEEHFEILEKHFKEGNRGLQSSHP